MRAIGKADAGKAFAHTLRLIGVGARAFDSEAAGAGGAIATEPVADISRCNDRRCCAC